MLFQHNYNALAECSSVYTQGSSGSFDKWCTPYPETGGRNTPADSDHMTYYSRIQIER